MVGESYLNCSGELEELVTALCNALSSAIMKLELSMPTAGARLISEAIRSATIDRMDVFPGLSVVFF